jgi:hypothetical protein
MNQPDSLETSVESWRAKVGVVVFREAKDEHRLAIGFAPSTLKEFPAQPSDPPRLPAAERSSR